MGECPKHCKPKTAVEQRRVDEKKGKERRSATPKLIPPSERKEEKFKKTKKKNKNKEGKDFKQLTEIDDNEHYGASHRHDRMAEDEESAQEIKREDDEQSTGIGGLDEDEGMLDDHVQLSIGHIIIDGPDHFYYQQHMRSILTSINESGDSAANLRTVIVAVREKGRELGMQTQALEAEKRLREAVLKGQGERLGRDAHDDSALVALTAGILSQRTQDAGFDASHFWRDVQKQLGLPTAPSRSTPARSIAGANDRRVHFGASAETRRAVKPQLSAAQTHADYGPTLDNAEPRNAQQKPLPLNKATKKLQRQQAMESITVSPTQLLKIARGVDLLFSYNELCQKSFAEAHPMLTECFEDAEDLYVANDVANQEWKNHRKHPYEAFDVLQACKYAKKFWASNDRGQEKQRAAWTQRHRRLLHGDISSAVQNGILSILNTHFVRMRGSLSQRLLASQAPVAVDDDNGIGTANHASSDNDVSDDDSSDESSKSSPLPRSMSPATKHDWLRYRDYKPEDRALERSWYGDNMYKVPPPIGLYIDAAKSISQEKMDRYCADAFDGFAYTGVRHCGDGRWFVGMGSKESARAAARKEYKIGKYKTTASLAF